VCVCALCCVVCCVYCVLWLVNCTRWLCTGWVNERQEGLKGHVPGGGRVEGGREWRGRWIIHIVKCSFWCAQNENACFCPPHLLSLFLLVLLVLLLLMLMPTATPTPRCLGD